IAQFQIEALPQNWDGLFSRGEVTDRFATSGLSRAEGAGGAVASGRRTARRPKTRASAREATTTMTIAKALSCGNRPISNVPSAAIIICKNPSSPEAAPAMRGWTLRPDAIAGGWLRPLPMELIAIGTNNAHGVNSARHQTASITPEASDNVRPTIRRRALPTATDKRATPALPAI